MERKNNLLELLAYIYETELSFVEDLDNVERSETGIIENWSAKDTLIHCAHWQGELANNLVAVSKGNPPEREDNISRANDAIFELHRKDSWEMAMAGLKDSYQRLSEQLQRLTEADLTNLEFFRWQNGRPIWRIIAGNGALHPLAHLAGYTRQHTGVKRILAAYEAVLPRLSELDESPGWQALLEYDLTCFCALAGQKERAIKSLSSSLGLSPDYQDLARQDTDLDSLRSEPGFLALFPSEIPKSEI